MKGLKKLCARLAAALAVCAAAVALTMCEAPTMWQGVSTAVSNANVLSSVTFIKSPAPQNYTEGVTAVPPTMTAQISAPPSVARLTVKWYREKDTLHLQWDKDTATEVASDSLFSEGFTAEGDNTFDTAYTLTADELKASGTYYYYAVVENAVYSAPAMAQINTRRPAVSAVAGGASYPPAETPKALSATVTLPADNNDDPLKYQWRIDSENIDGAAGTVNTFTPLEDGRSGGCLQPIILYLSEDAVVLATSLVTYTGIKDGSTGVPP